MASKILLKSSHIIGRMGMKCLIYSCVATCLFFVNILAGPCNAPNDVNPNSNYNLQQQFRGPYTKIQVNGQWVWNAPPGVAAELGNDPNLQYGTAVVVGYRVTDQNGNPVEGAQVTENVSHVSGPLSSLVTRNSTTDAKGVATDTLVVESNEPLTEATVLKQGLSVNGDCVKYNTLTFSANGVAVSE